MDAQKSRLLRHQQTRRRFLGGAAALGAGAAGLTTLSSGVAVPARAQDSVEISMWAGAAR